MKKLIYGSYYAKDDRENELYNAAKLVEEGYENAIVEYNKCVGNPNAQIEKYNELIENNRIPKSIIDTYKAEAKRKITLPILRNNKFNWTITLVNSSIISLVDKFCRIFYEVPKNDGLSSWKKFRSVFKKDKSKKGGYISNVIKNILVGLLKQRHIAFYALSITLFIFGCISAYISYTIGTTPGFGLIAAAFALALVTYVSKKIRSDINDSMKEESLKHIKPAIEKHVFQNFVLPKILHEHGESSNEFNSCLVVENGNTHPESKKKIESGVTGYENTYEIAKNITLKDLENIKEVKSDLKDIEIQIDKALKNIRNNSENVRTCITDITNAIQSVQYLKKNYNIEMSENLLKTGKSSIGLKYLFPLITIACLVIMPILGVVTISSTVVGILSIPCFVYCFNDKQAYKKRIFKEETLKKIKYDILKNYVTKVEERNRKLVEANKKQGLAENNQIVHVGENTAVSPDNIDYILKNTRNHEKFLEHYNSYDITSEQLENIFEEIKKSENNNVRQKFLLNVLIKGDMKILNGMKKAFGDFLSNNNGSSNIPFETTALIEKLSEARSEFKDKELFKELNNFAHKDPEIIIALVAALVQQNKAKDASNLIDQMNTGKEKAAVIQRLNDGGILPTSFVTRQKAIYKDVEKQLSTLANSNGDLEKLREEFATINVKITMLIPEEIIEMTTSKLYKSITMKIKSLEIINKLQEIDSSNSDLEKLKKEFDTIHLNMASLETEHCQVIITSKSYISIQRKIGEMCVNNPIPARDIGRECSQAHVGPTPHSDEGSSNTLKQ